MKDANQIRSGTKSWLLFVISRGDHSVKNLIMTN